MSMIKLLFWFCICKMFNRMVLIHIYRNFKKKNHFYFYKCKNILVQIEPVATFSLLSNELEFHLQYVIYQLEILDFQMDSTPYTGLWISLGTCCVSLGFNFLPLFLLKLCENFIKSMKFEAD